MYNFDYHQPSSLADAAQRLGAAAEGRLLAGGQTLLPTLKQRLASYSDVIDIGGIGELSGIEVAGGADQRRHRRDRSRQPRHAGDAREGLAGDAGGRLIGRKPEKPAHMKTLGAGRTG